MKIICAAEDPLAAISKGGSARVHSVYKNTVNLMAGESLISLQSSTAPMTPMALRTDISGEPLQSLFEAGDTVHLSKKGIEANNISIPMSRSLTTYSGALPPGTGHPVKKDLANLLSRCLAVAGKDSIFSGSEHLGGIETAAAEAAAEILRRAKADPMVLQELLGLGIGLTPSGDDFIIGVLAALQYYQQDELRAKIAEAVKNKLFATNDISAALLSHAIAGRYSERLLELLLHPSEGRAVVAASVGHSSGADTLFGILFTLKYII